MAPRLSTPADRLFVLVLVYWKCSGGQAESITQPYARQLNPADPLAGTQQQSILHPPLLYGLTVGVQMHVVSHTQAPPDAY